MELWKSELDKHDFAAAKSYLLLIYDHQKVVDLVVSLESHNAKAQFKAKDILRASGLPLLPKENPGVAKHLAHWADGELRSPILLVRDVQLRKVHIADGYHRMCAAYWTDENTSVDCRIV